MNEYKIMIVDAEPDILNLLEKALNIEGFNTVVKIDTGINAINTCKEIQPDIIILDIMLPDMKCVNKSGSFPIVLFCFFHQKMMS